MYIKKYIMLLYIYTYKYLDMYIYIYIDQHPPIKKDYIYICTANLHVAAWDEEAPLSLLKMMLIWHGTCFTL